MQRMSYLFQYGRATHRSSDRFRRYESVCFESGQPKITNLTQAHGISAGSQQCSHS